MIWFIVAINLYVLSFSKVNYFTEVSSIPELEIWVVFWASAQNNRPSDVLKDRLNVAYEAYQAGKIQKIIVSGDNGSRYYNEPVVMQKYLLEKWVSKLDIYLDYAGFDTYDTLYRAREIFGVSDVILFTQDFHLKRAMYIAERLWLHPVGVETNLHIYVSDSYNNFREIWARVKAFIEVEILKPKPKFLGEKIKILFDEDIEEAKKEILEK